VFDKIQHIGYLTPDLDAAIAWFGQSFGARKSGGSDIPKSYAVPSGGRNAYVRFGRVEVEIIEPEDRQGLSSDILTMHHVGYVVSDIDQVASTLRDRGFKFASDAPFTNVMGQQVLYFDASTTNDGMIHLTQLPVDPGDTGGSAGLEIENIVHAGYLVKNLEEAISWYVERLDGRHVGGGSSLSGGRNAFVNFGQVQVELIEPGDLGRITGSGHTMDHVGYVVGDIHSCMGQCVSRGFKLVDGAPITNSIKQQVAYFDTSTSMGSRMHLTQLPV
jgi:methylmalonyl-CoA/ethylmalonyl-CoA epimerase